MTANINETRNRLYKIGKYDELKKRNETKQSVSKLDLSGRSDEEIKMFSDNPEETNQREEKEEFRIKTKIPVFRPKPAAGQRSLFEETEQSSIFQSNVFQETPELNLLLTDSGASKTVEEDIVQVSSVDETIIKRLVAERKADTAPKQVNQEGKVELPKNVKLKFGDD
jgi:hypothetical protein